MFQRPTNKKVREALGKAGAGPIGNYSNCSFSGKVPDASCQVKAVNRLSALKEGLKK